MSSERRLEPRIPAEGRVLVFAPGVEQTARLVDQSRSGLRIRLNRRVSLPERIMVVDMGAGLAIPVRTVWQKNTEAGLKREGATQSLKGLLPSRLIAVRDAWHRAGGR